MYDGVSCTERPTVNNSAHNNHIIASNGSLHIIIIIYWHWCQFAVLNGVTELSTWSGHSLYKLCTCMHKKISYPTILKLINIFYVFTKSACMYKQDIVIVILLYKLSES